MELEQALALIKPAAVYREWRDFPICIITEIKKYRRLF